MKTVLTLDEILAPSRIAAAWAKLRANGGAAGEDAVTIRDLEESFPQVWPTIESSIRDGSYQPAPLRPVRIPKPGGDSRRLSIPSVIDRLIQHAVASAMTPRWEARFPKSSFAYRPGVGAHQAVDAVLETASLMPNPVALRMDIRDFFDRIPRRLLSDVLRDTPCDEASANLIQRAMSAPLASPLGPVPGKEGIPQGSPLSPLVSNAVLLSFDRSFADSPSPLFRYADDMLVLCNDEHVAHAMRDHAREQLSILGLELNAGKTRIQPLEDAVFLGFGFAREGGRWMRNLARETRDACLHHLVRMEDSGKSPKEMADFLRQWAAYFLPTQDDRNRHHGFLEDTRNRFRLTESDTTAGTRKKPPSGFTYSGASHKGPDYARLPWALRFLARRVRVGLNFRRKGLLPIPSGMHLTIGGHRFHIRF